MGYRTLCESCYGRGKVTHWLDPLADGEGLREEEKVCNKCGGTGQVKPYRRTLNLCEGQFLGWNDLPCFPRMSEEGACRVCNKKLAGRKTSFCSADCRKAWIFGVWKAAHWQKRSIYARDGSGCRKCGEVFEKQLKPGGPKYPRFDMLQLDHIQPLHLGGTEAPENCQLLCEACHKTKTARERRGGA